jgi:hypothetical protein
MPYVNIRASLIDFKPVLPFHAVAQFAILDKKTREYLIKLARPFCEDGKHPLVNTRSNSNDINDINAIRIKVPRVIKSKNKDIYLKDLQFRNLRVRVFWQAGSVRLIRIQV